MHVSVFTAHGVLVLTCACFCVTAHGVLVLTCACFCVTAHGVFSPDLCMFLCYSTWCFSPDLCMFLLQHMSAQQAYEAQGTSLVRSLSRLEEELHLANGERDSALADLASVRELCVKLGLHQGDDLTPAHLQEHGAGEGETRLLINKPCVCVCVCVYERVHAFVCVWFLKVKTACFSFS